MDYDLCIVGAGPAGLAAAIRFRDLCASNDEDLSVCVLEKGSFVGSHILSGNCFEPRALNELIPNWRELETPIHTHVSQDQISVLFKNFSVDIPNFLLPAGVHNHGNYVISLGELVAWLGEQAEERGVDIIPGFAADQVRFSSDGAVEGVITGDMGISKSGERKDTFEPGVEVRAAQTIFSEGCRGSLTQRLFEKYGLTENNVNQQEYGLGLKEVWQVDNKHFKPGLVRHTVGWPLRNSEYGGSFMYHMEPNLIHFGLVVGLDYRNPYLNPYEEFQKLKTHPDVAKYFEGGECISYGARALNEGGFHAVPKLTFPGGVLAGCSAGFLNVQKIKGTHNAMKTGMLAAESLFERMRASETRASG